MASVEQERCFGNGLPIAFVPNIDGYDAGLEVREKPSQKGYTLKGGRWDDDTVEQFPDWVGVSVKDWMYVLAGCFYSRH